VSEWELRAICPGCKKHFRSNSAIFFEVCPGCGERGEFRFGRAWERSAMRWVSNSNVRFFKPSTWKLEGHWETKP